MRLSACIALTVLTVSNSSEMGYKRGDPSSVHMDKMPLINEKGMAINYAAPHEDFVWQVRRYVLLQTWHGLWLTLALFS